MKETDDKKLPKMMMDADSSSQTPPAEAADTNQEGGGDVEEHPAATRPGAVAVGDSSSAPIYRESRKIQSQDKTQGTSNTATSNDAKPAAEGRSTTWRERREARKNSRQDGGATKQDAAKIPAKESEGSSDGSFGWKERVSGGMTLRQVERERQKLENEKSKPNSSEAKATSGNTLAIMNSSDLDSKSEAKATSSNTLAIMNSSDLKKSEAPTGVNRNKISSHNTSSSPQPTEESKAFSVQNEDSKAFSKPYEDSNIAHVKAANSDDEKLAVTADGDPIIQASLVSEPEIIEAIVHEERNYTKQIIGAAVCICVAIGLLVVVLMALVFDTSASEEPMPEAETPIVNNGTTPPIDVSPPDETGLPSDSPIDQPDLEPICFGNSGQLTEAVDKYVDLVYTEEGQNSPTAAETRSIMASTWGWPIGKWCVSNIDDFSTLFSGSRNQILSRFNEDLSEWDVSRSTNFVDMFWQASGFNQPIGDWDVSNALDMSYMFQEAVRFNQDISRWNVSKVTSLNAFLDQGTSFNQDLNQWDVSNTEAMNAMFQGCREFNSPLDQWNVHRVENMHQMFTRAESFDQNISGWDVSASTRMAEMFHAAYAFNSDISTWNVSRVGDLPYMFLKAHSFNQDIGRWDTSKVTNMEGAFIEALVFNQDIGRWNTSLTLNMMTMFTDAELFNQNLSDWDVASAEDLSYMFQGATSFRQNLCEWGSRMDPLAATTGMFSGSGCVVTDDPEWLPDGQGVSPLCDVCVLPEAP